ncbi:MAG TPA: hypothetical protein VF490_11065 [Chryseosolibacter sp.]
MKKNLETADTVVKLVLAVSVILLYLAGFIAGPFALFLLLLSFFILLFYLTRYFLKRSVSHRKG